MVEVKKLIAAELYKHLSEMFLEDELLNKEPEMGPTVHFIIEIIGNVI